MERRAEGFDPVAAEALGVERPHLGVADQFLRLVLLAVMHRNADRGGEEDFLLAKRDRRTERPPDRFGEGGDALRLVLGDQEERELVAG